MPNSVAPTRTLDVVAALEMGRQLGRLKAEIEYYIATNDIDDLWQEAVAQACEDTGKGGFAYWDRATGIFVDETPNALLGHSYTLDLSDGELRFTGYDEAGEEHSYVLPYKFLFPETREEALTELRERLEAAAAVEQKRAADQRRKDEAQFETLGRGLKRL